MRIAIVLVGSLAVLGLGCTSIARADAGRAVLKSTKGDVPTGEITLEDSPQGLVIRVSVSGAPPGALGFHIHQYGDCGDEGKAAGGHYNPAQAQHGDLLASGGKAHAGDLGNIQIGEDGAAQKTYTIPGLSLTQGSAAVAGRAFILHEKTDDLQTQPTGNAGGRIACGPIVLVSGGNGGS